MHVQQFYNKNQFIITGDYGARVFQSYDSAIACIDAAGRLTVAPEWDYSATTRKHFYLFLNDYKNDIAADQYAPIFAHSDNINTAKNKRAFFQKMIDKKIVKIKKL